MNVVIVLNSLERKGANANRAKRILIPFFFAALLGCKKAEPISQIKDESLLITTQSVSKPGSKVPDFPGASGFVVEVTNPYFAFARGEVFQYESETE